MRRYRNVYYHLAIALLIAGGAFAPTSYLLLKSIPLTALGGSMLILGVVCLSLARSLPKVSSETGSMLLEAGVENIATLVEELGLRAKAVYLPSSLTANGQPQALLPLSPNTNLSQLDRALPKRLIVKFGPQAEDIGLLVSTPGSVSASRLETKPDATAEDIGSSLTYILRGLLDVADGVRVVRMGEREIEVEVSHPRLDYKNASIYEWLGTPLASIVASVVAEAVDKPVAITEERQDKGGTNIKIGVLR
jgi:hypothetical protein